MAAPPGKYLQEAQISVGSQADFNGAYLDNDAQVAGPGDVGGPWTDYMVYNRYVDSPHTYMLAVTSPDGFQGDSCAFVQLAAGTLTMACDWTACRWGIQPEIPDPDINDEDWVFLGKTPETVSPPLGTDGVTPLYRISGTYYYGNRRPNPKTFPNMSFPRPAWCLGTYDRSVPSSILSQSIIMTGSQGGKNKKSNGLLTGFVVTT